MSAPEPVGFLNQLQHLINRYSLENDSNTPDFILAQYLVRCLDNFSLTTGERERWWGRGDPWAEKAAKYPAAPDPLPAPDPEAKP